MSKSRGVKIRQISLGLIPSDRTVSLLVFFSSLSTALAVIAVIIWGSIYAADRHKHGSGSDPISSLVDLGYAKYQGATLPCGVNQYLGIRYAAPPLGDRRFRAPQPPLREKVIQDVSSQFPPACIGTAQGPETNLRKEDCLYVSIFAPSNATTTSKLPVWFFIQGGGFAINSNPDINGTGVVLASGRQMVFVELNYRVGALGFLASEKVRADGDLNAGLLDQRAVLQWIQDYIHHFGGDPDHVVIQGASAGAGSVAHHLTAYGGKEKPKFVGAIVESPFLPTQRNVAESEWQFDIFATALGCPSSASIDHMACLRGIDIGTLQTHNVVAPFPDGPANPLPNWTWLPVVDGILAPDTLYNLFHTGRLSTVPIIVGDDTDEGTQFTVNANSQDAFRDFIQANYPSLKPLDLQTILNIYANDSKTFPTRPHWFGPAEDAYGEATFICPGLEMTYATARSPQPPKSWQYRYNVQDKDLTVHGLGVPHTSEKAAVFGPDYFPNCNGCSYTTYNAPMVPILQKFWTSFVMTLDPNTQKDASAPEWLSWGDSQGQRLKLELNANVMEAIPDAQQDRCFIWKDFAIANRTEQK